MAKHLAILKISQQNENKLAHSLHSSFSFYICVTTAIAFFSLSCSPSHSHSFSLPLCRSLFNGSMSWHLRCLGAFSQNRTYIYIDEMRRNTTRHARERPKPRRRVFVNEKMKSVQKVLFDMWAVNHRSGCGGRIGPCGLNIIRWFDV